MMITSKTNPQHQRGGFTLIELLAVIIVITILISLLAPVAGRSIRNAREAGVKTEISQLEAAIANFKNIHGVEPPSNITLYQLPAGWAGDATSTAMIRQIWPQFNFNLTRSYIVGPNSNTSVTLTGSECLVFFLGGRPNIDTSTGKNVYSMTGFSKDPTDPFAAGGSREAPLFEFQVNRLMDYEQNLLPEYKDAIPNQTYPYLYYSSYDGQGYNVYNANLNPATGTTSEFYCGTLPNASTPACYLYNYSLTNQSLIPYGLYNCYYQDAAQLTSWNPNRFQIISPGYDGAYGYGGTYIPGSNSTLPLASSYSSALTSATYSALRTQEADNITNFSQGRLQP